MGQPGRPQQVLGPPARSAIFLVATVRAGAERRVLDALADVPGLTRGVSFREPEQRLRCVVGIGSELWDRLYGSPRPKCLRPFRAVAGTRHTAVATPGDLLFHIRAMRADLCFELAKHVVRRLTGSADVVDEVHGFRYFDERDLLGFVDGTENPSGADAVEAVEVGAEDPGFAGGSYVVVQKYLHDLAAWEALSVAEQERAIGRTKLDDIELPDAQKAPNSHVAVNTIVDADGTQRQIVRENLSFGSVAHGEFGTYFIGYTADPGVIERMLHDMFVGDPAGNHDRILDFSTPVTGNLFFVPTVDLLENPPAAAYSGDIQVAVAEPPADGSLMIGSLNHTRSTPT